MSLDDNIEKLSQNFVKTKTKKQNKIKQKQKNDTKTKFRTGIFSLVEIVENLK